MNEQVYAEGYAVILALGEDYIKRLPKDVFEFIKNKSNKYEIPNIDENKALDEQGLSQEALAMIAMLRLDYWCDSEEEKAEFLKYLDITEEQINEILMSATSTRELLKLLHPK